MRLRVSSEILLLLGRPWDEILHGNTLAPERVAHRLERSCSFLICCNYLSILTDRLKMLVERKLHRKDLGAATVGPFAAGQVEHIVDHNFMQFR